MNYSYRNTDKSSHGNQSGKQGYKSTFYNGLIFHSLSYSKIPTYCQPFNNTKGLQYAEQPAEPGTKILSFPGSCTLVSENILL